MEVVPITKEEIKKEIPLHHDLQATCRQEEEICRQKSRILWLKAGDRNTAYFHKQAEARKHYKTIQEIHLQDHVVIDFDKIKEEATRYFSANYSADLITNPTAILELIPNPVKRNDNIKLIKGITLEELKEAIDDMENDKAPGPDGFNASFIKIC